MCAVARDLGVYLVVGIDEREPNGGTIYNSLVYISPDEEQLQAILTALNERRLPFGDLQNYGAAGGGTSTIPV